MTGTIAYRVNLSGSGWLDWVEDAREGGSSQGAMPLEAVSMKLTGELGENYDVLYSVLPMSEIPQKSHRIPPRIKSDFQTRIFRKRDVHMIVYPGITENRDIFIAVFFKSGQYT